MTEKNLLIYGLSRERVAYCRHVITKDLSLKDSKLMDEHLKDYFIDEYNDKLSLILEDEWRKKINRKSAQVTGWDSEENFLKFIKEISYMKENREEYPLWEAYFSHFQSQHPMKTLQEIYNDCLLKVAKKGKLSYFDLRPYLHVIRGCKIGLQMANSLDDLVIHFVLDNMGFEGVVTKNEDEYGDSATSRELRYVYRNWANLKEKVIFIENNERVKALWEEDPVLWKRYQPKKNQEQNEPRLE